MDTPPLVRDHLDGEAVTSRVDLGGDDAVFVTPSRTLVYRGDGLLSDESVGAFPHDVERLSLSVGRRKATLDFEYVDDRGTFSVPSGQVDDLLRPVLTGVLRTAEVLDPDEEVRTVHRFKELTLVVSDGRVVKHVGNALWDHDFEAFPYEGLTDLDLEEGSVSDQLVMAVDGRPQRVKIPADEAPALYAGVEEAVLSYHGVESVADLRDEEADAEADDVTDALGDDNIAPLVDRDGEAGGDAADDGDADDGDAADDAGSSAADEQDDDGDGADSADAADDESDDDDAGEWVSGADLKRGEEILARLDELEEAVDRQTELIEAQRETIDRLVEELQRGR